MKALSNLPTLDKDQWSNINSNGTSVGKDCLSNWVVMDNILIRIRGQSNIKIREQKLLEYLISLIDLKNPTRKIKVKKRDMINFLFPKARNKKSTEFNHYYYTLISESFAQITFSNIIIKFDNKKGTMWIPYGSFLDHEDIQYAIVVFSPEIFPFLCFLKGNFTQYQLEYIKKIKGKYSIGLYKYFKIKYNNNNKIVSWQEDLKDLKFMLNIEQKYKEFKNIKAYILNPSIKEINEHTDLKITYNVIRGGSNGMKILAIEFTAKNKYNKMTKEKNNFNLQKSIIDKTIKKEEEPVVCEVKEPVPIQEPLLEEKTENKETKEERKKQSFFNKLFRRSKK